MIPAAMKSYLDGALPSRVWDQRVIRRDGKAFMEFGPMDVDRLSRLGIVVDHLGPYLVVCMWDEEHPLEVGGYLVVDNLAMGRPSMGGIRMLPDLIPSTVYNLARGMTLKNAAAALPFGGGKSGIVCGRNLTPEEHTEVVRAFAHLIYRYQEIYLPGPDVGTNDADMKTIAIEKGIDNALSKPTDMGGARIDELGAAAGGVVIAIDALLDEIQRLKPLPQFPDTLVPGRLTFIIQGFGAVGAHAAMMIQETFPDAEIIGISDREGYLFNDSGLPVDRLFKDWQEHGLVTRKFYGSVLEDGGLDAGQKFGSDPNDLLRESAFCLIPAAPIANYMDTVASTNPCITVDQRGNWRIIVEGANTYSPDPDRRHARSRMERVVYREGGVLIATDYLVNSGGVIFAAQERLIKTPDHLRFPESILGDRAAVDRWLRKHAHELEQLAESRRIAGEELRDRVIRQNMTELVDQLVGDTDMLPNEAAERISIQRIAKHESDRSAVDIMTSIPVISIQGTVQDAAKKLVNAQSAILAVISEGSGLEGVITEWDITRATATGCSDNSPLSEIMTRKVVSAAPDDGILTILRKMEEHEISAMPVVEDQKVLGMVCTDVLARGSLSRLLQTEDY